MRHRMAAAALALFGLLLSIYLTLYKLGFTGPLVCGTGGCERVQTSRWAELFGVPVAAYGVAGYLALLVIAMAGLSEKRIADPAPTRWLVLVSGLGVAFSLYLTSLELFVIHAICRWCVASAVVITAIFVVSLVGRKGEWGVGSGT
jgi:uncharacterized membrane protein